MKANAMSLLAIFEKKMRLEVPLFQRQYIWQQEQQWEPLWEDIERKFLEYVEGRKDAPVHFLGAMVLDQKQTPTTHVDKRQVIDGQQRLTTLQIFLAALRDFCRAQACEELAKECESFTLNKGMMANPEVDKFKVWPTQLDRQQFDDVISSLSREELEQRHPLVKRKFHRHPDPRPRMVEAYLFFYNAISEFFLGSETEPPLYSDYPLSVRLEECFQALKNALQVVVIDLETGDDAQVIFETLNARGEPLLPADLLRNYIFLRAAQSQMSQDALYDKYWRRFDDEFWRTEVRQGRLKRSRSDLFLQHFLSSRQTVDIPMKQLYVEYKHWIETAQPFRNVEAELDTLSRQGEDFRRITTPQKSDVLYPLSQFLDPFDVGTAYPLLLAFLDHDVSDGELKDISVILESYLLRRAVCGLTTKNYNRVFLQVVKNLRESGFTAPELQRQLLSLTGESVLWPSDELFRTAWTHNHLYRALNNPKIVYILRRLSDAYMNAKVEALDVSNALSVEHILPQTWTPTWPLPSGATGMNSEELEKAEIGDVRAEATRSRNALLQTIGNLTILTQSLNSTVSNSSWEVKKPALLQSSLLPINQQLYEVERWDEDAISYRSRELFVRALKIWPKPHRFG